MPKAVKRKAKQYLLSEKKDKLLTKVQNKTGKKRYELIEEAIGLLAMRYEIKQASYPTRNEIVKEQKRIGNLMKALCRGYENTHKEKMPYIHIAVAEAVVGGSKSPTAVWEAAKLKIDSVYPSFEMFKIYIEANGIPKLPLAKKICKRAEEEELDKRF